MRYVVLGPVALTTDTGPLLLGRPQRRAVLALLVLNANRVVPGDQLIEALWGGTPPATARAQLHALIAAVRRGVRAAGAVDAIATQAGGYVLTAADEESDLGQFRRLTARARSCADAREARTLLSDALALWSGTPLDGITAAFVEPARAQLEECRPAACEQLTEIELALGQHREVLPELTALVAEHPLRERLVGQLMTALYRSGRQAEALQAGRALRRRLADDEGLDPGPELLELETAILRADPALAAPSDAADTVAPSARPAAALPAGQIPRQLPEPVAELVGREAEAAMLDDLVSIERDAPVTIVLSGPPGVGTTALAVHWAHRRIACFPDGQVFLDGSLTPAEAVGEVLRAFGVAPDDLPADDHQAQAAYQEVLANRRALVLVDDAAGPDLLRSLRPVRGATTVLATATGRVDVGTDVPVGALRADASVRLLGRVLGGDPVDSAPDAARMLAARCAHLPLALLVAGANLAAHPGRTLHQHAALAGGDRLGTAAEQSPTGAAFALAYADLDATERDLLHRIARCPGADVAAWSAAALIDGTLDEARLLLERLTAAYLLTERPGGRFAVHPALRALAAGAAPVDAAVDALDRLAAAHLAVADHAARLLYPHLTRLPVPGGDGPDPLGSAAEARTWLAAERVNLVATIEHAAATGRGPTAWLLADALRGYFSLTMRVADWRRAADAALAAAETHGSEPARSAAHLSLAELHLRSSQHPGALRDAWQVLATTGRPLAGTPGLTAAVAAPRRTRSPGRILLMVFAVLALCTSAVQPGTAAAAGDGPARVVYQWSVAELRPHEGIDFDEAGRMAAGSSQGVDVMPWASGNVLSGKSDAKLAWAPEGRTDSYETCSRIPVATRTNNIRGLHQARDGRRMCVYTRPGHVALLTLTRAPRLREPGVAFTYVVWQGSAPPSTPVPALPAGTELVSAALTVPDKMGVDIDGDGAIVSQDEPGVDVTPYGRGSNLRVKNGAVIATLPAGSPGTYTACAEADGTLWVVGAQSLRDRAGRRLCLRSYGGRIALLTLGRPATDDYPHVTFDLRVWQGPSEPGPPEPASWVREQYPNADRTEKKHAPDTAAK